MSYVGNKKEIIQNILDGMTANVDRTVVPGVTILPREARDLLKLVDPDFLPLKGKVVRALTQQLRMKRWVYSPYPLVVGTHARIIDGQHRLRACVKSDEPIILDVMVGYPHADKWCLPHHTPLPLYMSVERCPCSQRITRLA